MNVSQQSTVQTKPFNEWSVNNQTVRVYEQGKLKTGGRLTSTVSSGSKTVERPIPIPVGLSTRQLDKIPSYLLACDVLLETGKAPVFLKPRRKWVFKKKEKVVSLLLNEENLVCQIFDKTHNKSIQHKAVECIVPSNRCHKETLDLIEKIKTKSMEDIVFFLKKFNVIIVEDYPEYMQEISTFHIIDPKFSKQTPDADKPSTAPFQIEIQPISAKSQLDKRVRVSTFRWAVTLITYGGEAENHAEICFEGIKHRRYFCKVAHFTGKRILINNVVGEVPVSTRSEIWMRKSEKVQKVIKKIKEEQAQNMQDLAEGKPPLFYIYGKKSYSNTNGGINCLDWAKKPLGLLKIGLEENPIKKSVKNTGERIAAAARLYTRVPSYYKNKPINISQLGL